MMRLRLIIPLAASLMASTALAHGVETRELTTGAVAVEFRFTDGTTMALSEAMAFAPNHPDEPSVTGRTDEHGRFSFFPDQDGDWTVEVRDGDGHTARTVVTVADHKVIENRHAFPDWLVAVSLVFNVLAAALIGRRRATKVQKP
jgi:nickel transport protein